MLKAPTKDSIEVKIMGIEHWGKKGRMIYGYIYIYMYVSLYTHVHGGRANVCAM